MSVLQRNRTESKMEFINSAHELELMTIRLVHRENVIPKRYRLTLGSKLIESVRKINQYVTYANGIYPKKDAELVERNKLQVNALLEIRNLLELMRLTSELFPIKGTVLEEWTRLALKEEHAIKCWKQSDKKRN